MTEFDRIIAGEKLIASLSSLATVRHHFVARRANVVNTKMLWHLIMMVQQVVKPTNTALAPYCKLFSSLRPVDIFYFANKRNDTSTR